ncbi:MAG: hypothetical protein ABSC08_15335 [Bryobacteraceae bacterium]|jgi:hypothetical protein
MVRSDLDRRISPIGGAFVRMLLALGTLCFSAVFTFADDAGRWKHIESFKYRQEERGGIERTFVLESPAESEMEQSFTRLRIKTVGQPEFVLTNEFAWWIKPAAFQNWFSRRKNAVNSQYVFGLRTLIGGTPHTLLFLVGWPFASSPGSLHILDLRDDQAPAVILRKEELELVGISDVNGDGFPEIIGAPCMSQEWGDHLLTYDPIHVYVLQQGRSEATLSIPLSRAYNEKHYYGWVGPQCSEDWAIVLHPPNGGKPIIMKAADAEKLRQRPPKK